MAETDQPPPSSGNDGDAQGAAYAANGTGVDGAPPVSDSEVVWILGEASPGEPAPDGSTGSIGGGDLLLAAIVPVQVPVELPANLDQALDQLTTGTDLFDLPVFDLHSS